MKMFGTKDANNKTIRLEMTLPENVDGVLLEPFGAHNAVTDKKYYFSREDRIRKFGMENTRKYSYGINLWDPKQMKKMSDMTKARSKAKFKKAKQKLLSRIAKLKKKQKVSIQKWKAPKKKKLKLPFMKHRLGTSGLKDRMSRRRFVENLHEGVYPQRGYHKFNKNDWKFKKHPAQYHTVAARMKAIKKRRANRAKELAALKKKAAAKAKAKKDAAKNSAKKKKSKNVAGLGKPRVLASNPNEMKLNAVLGRMTADDALLTHGLINDEERMLNPIPNRISASRFSGTGPERLLAVSAADLAKMGKPKVKKAPKQKKLSKSQEKIKLAKEKKAKEKKQKAKKKKNIFEVMDQIKNKVTRQFYKDVISQPLEHGMKPKPGKKKDPNAPTPPEAILIELPNEIFDKTEARSKIMSFVHEFEKEGLDPLMQLDHVNFKYNTTSLIAKRFALPEKIDRRVMQAYVALNKKLLKEFNNDVESVDIEDFDSVDEKLRDAKDLMKVRSVLMKTGEDPLKVAQLSMEIRKIETMAREAEARNKIVKAAMRARLNRKGHTDLNKNKFPDYHHHFDLYYNDTFHGIEEMFANIFGS